MSQQTIDFSQPVLANGPALPPEIMRFLNGLIRLVLDNYAPGRFNGQLFTTDFSSTKITARVVPRASLDGERVSLRILRGNVQTHLYADIITIVDGVAPARADSVN
jgi:hypothetical protein